MFVYYFVHVERPFVDAEAGVLRLVAGLSGWADEAYREGEAMRASMAVGGARSPIAKTVRIEVGAPMRGYRESTIPLTWEATGTPGLFPRMEADLVVASIGPELTQIALRGSYRPPLGLLGRALDRALLHRIAEASVKRFVDRLAAALGEAYVAG